MNNFFSIFVVGRLVEEDERKFIRVEIFEENAQATLRRHRGPVHPEIRSQRDRDGGEKHTPSGRNILSLDLTDNI